MTAPVERFLGVPDAEAANPFALLGLPVADVSERQVEDARARRLAQVDAHAQAGGAEADEVRLAVQVAAAQLRDRDVRFALLDRVDRPGIVDPREQTPPTAPIHAETRGVPPRPRPARPTPHAPASSADAPSPVSERAVALQLMAVIAHSGGWNDTARSRVAAVAHASGMTVDDAVRLIGLATRSTRRTPAFDPRTANRGAEAAIDEGRSAEQRLKHRLLIAASLLLFAVSAVLAGTIAWIIIGGTTSDGQAPPSQTATTSGTSTPRSVTSNTLGDAGGNGLAALTGDASALSDRFAEATAMLQSDERGALALFRAAFENASRSWGALAPESFARLAYQAFDFIAAAETAGVGDAAVAYVAGAMLPDLAAERERRTFASAAFAGATLTRVRAASLPALGPTVERALASIGARPAREQADDIAAPVAGAAAALEHAGRVLLNANADEATWQRWVETVEDLHQVSPGVRSRLSLGVIGAAMGGAGEPEAAQRGLGVLVPMVDWPDVIARGEASRFLGWFANRDVTAPRLAEWTRLMVESAALPQLDSAMILSETASVQDRNTLARRWRGAVISGASRSPTDSLTDRWAERSGRAIATIDLASEETQLADALARVMHLNAAGALLWVDERDAAERMLNFSEETIALETHPVRDVDLERLTSHSRAPDGVWAADFLDPRNDTTDRMRALRELPERGGPRGPADADVLARAAIVGDEGTRRIGQEVILRYADELLVVNALSESIHNAAPRRDVSRMLETVTGASLPPSGDRDWEARAQAALASRLVELIATLRGGPVAELERAADRSYAARLTSARGEAPPGSDAPDAPAAPTIEQPLGLPASVTGPSGAWRDAEALVDAWLRNASRYPEGGWTRHAYDELVSRRDARARVARGDLRRFAAAQLSLVEVMAFVIGAESPSRADAVLEVLDDMAARRREAATVFQQMLAVERAIARLWLIRTGRVPGAGDNQAGGAVS